MYLLNAGDTSEEDTQAMRIANLTTAAVVAALAATSAFAQSQPGAGAPSNDTGAPTAPNASIAPSMVPNGSGQGTQANAMTNSGTMSADQGPGAQTAQPGMRHSHHSRSTGATGSNASGMNSGSSSMSSDPATPMDPSSSTGTPPR